jgi:predicted transcriptional regulator
MVDQLEMDLLEKLTDPEFASLYGEECAKSEFGLALFHARKKGGMTQQELANKFGYSQPYIAQLESGEVNLTMGAAGKMLAALGLKMVINTEPLGPAETSNNAVVDSASGLWTMVPANLFAAENMSHISIAQSSVNIVIGSTDIYHTSLNPGDLQTPIASPVKIQAVPNEPELVLAA